MKHCPPQVLAPERADSWRCSTRHGPSWSRPDKMFSAVDYGRDLNVTHLTTRLRRHCIPVRQKHLSHHSTAGDIRSPPPLAAPSPAATRPRGHVTWSRHVVVTCTSVSTAACLEPSLISFHLSEMDRDCSVELAVVPSSSSPSAHSV